MSDVKELVEMYAIRRPPGNSDYYQWSTVNKAEFARSDVTGFSGTPDEIAAAIAAHEGLPESFIMVGPHGVRISANEHGHLALCMEYTKRHHVTIHVPGCTKSRVVAEVGKDVQYVGDSTFVINGEWVLGLFSLSYDPEGAKTRLADAKAGRGAKVDAPGKKRRTRIDAYKLLWPLSRGLRDVITGLTVFRQTYVGRSWRRKDLLALRSPSTNNEIVWAVPIMAEFVVTVTRRHGYRTYEFVKAAKALAKDYLDDILMVENPAFKEFILKESKVRMPPKPKEDATT